MRRIKRGITNILPMVLYAVFTVVVILLFILGCVPLLTFGGAMVALAAAFFVYWFSYVARKKQLILIGFTSKYLLEKEGRGGGT